MGGSLSIDILWNHPLKQKIHKENKKITILATAIGPRNRGIGQYEIAVLPLLIAGLVKLGHSPVIIISKDAPNIPSMENAKIVRLPVKRDWTWLRLLFEQIYVPWLGWGADAFVSLESVFPFIPFKARSKIVIVHDIHVLRHWKDPKNYPEEYSLQYKIWAYLATRAALSASTKIITVSQFTKNEIHELFGIPLDRIVPIHNGMDQERFRPVKDRCGNVSACNLPTKYYLFIGPFSQKKNLRIIVEALALSKPKDFWRLPVVVAGDPRRNALYGRTLKLIRGYGLGRDFVFLGSVPDRDVPWLYSNARAFIYPSYYEGFGLPPIEAMACGTPVIASDRSSLPEILGDAALYIDPDNPRSLVESLKRINQLPIRKALIDKGLKRSRLYRWEKTAHQLCEAILD